MVVVVVVWLFEQKAIFDYNLICIFSIALSILAKKRLYIIASCKNWYNMRGGLLLKQRFFSNLRYFFSGEKLYIVWHRQIKKESKQTALINCFGLQFLFCGT